MKRRDALPLPEPCALRRDDAAAYVGVSPGTFDKAVRAGQLPQPVMIGSCPVWPRWKLHQALDPSGSDSANSWDAAIRDASIPSV